ncbi:nickel insertion protein [Sporomusa sp. KB1]|uniref:nickel insertion protein n=1 Tax=Sporomusa sp. KB1 TaxID=943346 RepID=UPI001C952EA2
MFLERDQQWSYASSHRSLKDSENIIINSSLSDRVKKVSLAIFMKVAEAEAKVHGKPRYEVYFHEVGPLTLLLILWEMRCVCLRPRRLLKII